MRLKLLNNRLRFETSLVSFLREHDVRIGEGNCMDIPEQQQDLINLTKIPIRTIMEIGFNAGHSADVFLKNNPNSTLVSFDIGHHEYVHTAKRYIDLHYPNRHTLILGNSMDAVPQYAEQNDNKKFDVIFIDGGHDYATVRADLLNCRKLSHTNTLVLLDDTIYKKEWELGHTIGPTNAWVELLNDDSLIELGRKEYRLGRGMSWGKYTK
jgi:predicted O-methyltransferase YrrM